MCAGDHHHGHGQRQRRGRGRGGEEKMPSSGYIPLRGDAGTRDGQPAARTPVCLYIERHTQTRHAADGPVYRELPSNIRASSILGGGDIWGKGNGNRHLAVVPTPQGAARPSDIRQTGASVSVGMKHGERGEKKKTHLRWDEWCRRRRRLDGRRHAGQPSRRTCLSRRRIVCVCVGGGRWAVDGDTTWPDTRRAQPAMREEEVSVWTAYGGGWRREDRGGRRWTGTGMDDCSSTRGTKDPGQVRSPKVQGGGIGGFFSFSPASRSHEDGEKSFDSDPESDRE